MILASRQQRHFSVRFDQILTKFIRCTSIDNGHLKIYLILNIIIFLFRLDFESSIKHQIKATSPILDIIFQPFAPMALISEQPSVSKVRITPVIYRTFLHLQLRFKVSIGRYLLRLVKSDNGNYEYVNNELDLGLLQGPGLGK
jgi:hypothetical protein